MTTKQPFDIHRALSSFNLTLRAQNQSPKTVELYSLAVRQLTVFPEGEGHSCQVGAITRDHINGYLSELHQIHKPSTVDTGYRSLQAFFKFLMFLTKRPGRFSDGTIGPMAKT
jgi:site-specific recombinase XerD